MNVATLKDRMKHKKQDDQVFKPLFFKLSTSEGRIAFEKLLSQNNQIQVYDEIVGQVEELIKSTNPKIVYSKSELNQAALDHLKNIPHEEYGIWVYYPWSNRMVHILEENEFITVRTNRNQYKITPEERTLLATKKVGVMGLSVGQSIALTLAMERSFGELRIADFDILELSNFNRIRTGLHNLGVSKVVTVAREIMEIDPYLNVKCYTDGITEDNIDQYITEGGNLDVLVDECDGLYVKILCRQKAKHYKIPVIMDTSDRGMIDVERFDLEPNRPIFHGYIDHLDISKVKEAKTNEEKVPYLLPMLGVDTVSDRMKASMLEIEQTITTWPQLASAVTMGSGLAADVSRHILLDQFRDSGRYFIDVEELICNKDKFIDEPLSIRPSISLDQMKDIIDKNSLKEIPNVLDLDKVIIHEIVEAAGMAPSGANIQPWKFIWKDKVLYMFFDDRYSAGLLDCGNTTSFATLGCAVENLVLKAHSLNLEVVIDKPKLERHSKLICTYRFLKEISTEVKELVEPHKYDELVETIPHRLTNRNIGKRHKIEKSRLDYLQEVARSVNGADLIIIDNEKTLNELKEVTAVMDKVRVTHKGGHQDFRAEIRWTPEEALAAKNGVDLIGTVDLTSSELAGWSMVKNWSVVDLLNEWNVGNGLGKIQRKSIDSSSAVALLTVPSFSCEDFFIGGRALERVWLAANKDNICVHPASLSVLIYNTFLHCPENSFPEKMRVEVKNSRERFEKLFNIKEKVGEVVLLRFFIDGPPKSRAVRYPVEDILNYI